MTLKLVQHPEEFYSTVEWDRLIHTTLDPKGLMESINPARGPVYGRRYVQAAAATMDNELLVNALEMTAELWPGKYPGTVSWAVMSLKRFDEVLATAAIRPETTSHYDLEDACDAEAARASSAAERRDYPVALAHIYAGQLLAGSLGMKYRTQWMRLEMGRILGIMGRPDSKLLREAMEMLPMSERRAKWSTRTLAENLVGEGDLQAALDLLQDAPADDFRQFVEALMNTEVDPEVLASAAGNYGDLARAVRQARIGDFSYSIDLKQYQPQLGYSILLRALAMIRSGHMAAQAFRSLVESEQELVAPDQRALRQILMLGALTAAGDGVGAAVVVEELNQALSKLIRLQHVLPWLRSVAPDQFALAALIPGVHIEVAHYLREIPLLLGEHITVSSSMLKLPGKAAGGLAMVMSAFRGEPITVHRQQRKRLAEALEAEFGTVPYVVNLGECIRNLALLRDAAPKRSRSQWDMALRSAVEMVDSRSVKREMSQALRLEND